MTPPALMLLAWLIEVLFGWPGWALKRIGHPVIWLGALISRLSLGLNRPDWSHRTRYLSGILTTSVAVGMAFGLAWLISRALPETVWGIALEALIASSLIASRSLYTHVRAIALPLMNDISAARVQLAKIVGRDPERLDEHGIARASLESLAENASDGVVAPLFWGALLGLPGIAAYKAINTLDSMIGHRTPAHAAFGGFSARLDDIANLVPARLTGLLIALASLNVRAAATMIRDAGKHRSPNAGWPEAAMAGALNVRLSGPRVYDGDVSADPWLNKDAPDPAANDISKGLALYVRSLALVALILLGVTGVLLHVR